MGLDSRNESTDHLRLLLTLYEGRNGVVAFYVGEHVVKATLAVVYSRNA